MTTAAQWAQAMREIDTINARTDNTRLAITLQIEGYELFKDVSPSISHGCVTFNWKGGSRLFIPAERIQYMETQWVVVPEEQADGSEGS